MLKIKNNTGHIPNKIKSLLNREVPCKSFIPSNKAYNSEEWYIFISSCVDFVFNRSDDAEKTNAITAYIYNHFKERRLFPEFFTENIDYFEESDLEYYYNYILEMIDSLFIANNYKYRGLFDSTIFEFNPLWNVDGVETTTRTLNQEGTINTDTSGNDSTAYTGTDTTNHTGTDTNKRTGTDTDRQTGTDTNAHTGTQTIAQSGTDATAHTGTQAHTLDADNADTIEEGNQDIVSNTTFNDSTYYGASKTETAHDSSETHSVDQDELTTFNDTVTETKNLTDQTSYNDTMTDTKNLTDERTYNITDQRTANLTDQNIRNLLDESEHENNSLITRDLIDTEKIILERHGNIGVTTTTKLLTEFREYVCFNFMDIVAKDIVNLISYAIY